jgi:hypothetical protein
VGAAAAEAESDAAPAGGAAVLAQPAPRIRRTVAADARQLGRVMVVRGEGRHEDAAPTAWTPVDGDRTE